MTGDTAQDVNPSGDVALDRDPYGISHVFEYRHAATTLLNAPADTRRFLARPICYLARHALELALKNALSLADAEYHHSEIDYRPFQKTWTTHDLVGLLDSLDHLLLATNNPAVPASVRDLVVRLHALDPDGQRFRYAKARVRGGDTVLSLAKDARVDLNALVSDVDAAIDILFNLDPESPRNRRERTERLAVLTATQRLPVHTVEKGFGGRRSADGYVLLPTSASPGLNVGDLVRLMEPDSFDLSWTIVRVDGPDYVLDHFGDSLRLPAVRIAQTIADGKCPVCLSNRTLTVQPMEEETVIFAAGVVHRGAGHPRHSPDRMCRSCGHRFESQGRPEAGGVTGAPAARPAHDG